MHWGDLGQSLPSSNRGGLNETQDGGLRELGENQVWLWVVCVSFAEAGCQRGLEDAGPI